MKCDQVAEDLRRLGIPAEVEVYPTDVTDASISVGLGELVDVQVASDGMLIVNLYRLDEAGQVDDLEEYTVVCSAELAAEVVRRYKN